MKNLFIAIMLLITSSLTAQIVVTWKGGTPGRESEWNEARNWSENRVPDEHSIVVIENPNSGHFSQPVLDNSVQVAWVKLMPGSSLQILQGGELVIDGQYTYTEGLTDFGGRVHADGDIILRNIDLEYGSYHFDFVVGNAVKFENNLNSNQALALRD